MKEYIIYFVDGSLQHIFPTEREKFLEIGEAIKEWYRLYNKQLTMSMLQRFLGKKRGVEINRVIVNKYVLLLSLGSLERGSKPLIKVNTVVYRKKNRKTGFKTIVKNIDLR